jgi:hypothetical protein
VGLTFVFITVRGKGDTTLSEREGGQYCLAPRPQKDCDPDQKWSVLMEIANQWGHPLIDKSPFEQLYISSDLS